jgi:hypothetical protein
MDTKLFYGLCVWLVYSINFLFLYHPRRSQVGLLVGGQRVRAQMSKELWGTRVGLTYRSVLSKSCGVQA